MITICIIHENMEFAIVNRYFFDLQGIVVCCCLKIIGHLHHFINKSGKRNLNSIKW